MKFFVSEDKGEPWLGDERWNVTRFFCNISMGLPTSLIKLYIWNESRNLRLQMKGKKKGILFSPFASSRTFLCPFLTFSLLYCPGKEARPLELIRFRSFDQGHCLLMGTRPFTARVTFLNATQFDTEKAKLFVKKLLFLLYQLSTMVEDPFGLRILPKLEYDRCCVNRVS